MTFNYKKVAEAFKNKIEKEGGVVNILDLKDYEKDAIYFSVNIKEPTLLFAVRFSDKSHKLHSSAYKYSYSSHEVSVYPGGATLDYAIEKTLEFCDFNKNK